MTSHVRHRRTSIPGALPGTSMEPGELGVNLADLKLYTSTGGAPIPLLGVQMFTTTANYAIGEMVNHDRMIWVCKVAVTAGLAFDEADWNKLSEADVGNAVDDAMAAHVAQADPHTQYATDVDLATHVAASDPHTVYAKDSDLLAHVQATDPHPQYATDTDLTAGIAAHEAKPNPHPQYATISNVTPPGTIAMYAGPNPPTGWLKCNGAQVGRSAYTALFNAISTWWGGGDGSTTFNLPDMRGAFVRGTDEGRGIDPSRGFATNQGSQNLSHNHGVNDPTHAHGVYDPTHVHGAWVDAQGVHNHYVNDPGHAHANSVAVNQWGLRNENWATFWITQANQGRGGTDGALTGIWLNNDGNHAHNAWTDARGTGIGIYAAGTGISIQAAGIAESRPWNVAVIYIIKY